MTNIEVISRFGGNHTVLVDPYALNPLAEELRQSHPEVYTAASAAAGPPPRMFGSGTSDLPTFTASGIDPKVLLQLPYTARHYAAAEPSLSVVHALFEQAASDPDYAARHEGLDSAVNRMTAWAAGRMDRVNA